MKKMGEETRGGRGRRHFWGCGDADDPGACLSPGGILIAVYNALLEEPAAEKECLYLNVTEAVTVKNDCLRKELTSDGIHLHTAECVEWWAYLKAHPVEKGL